MKIIRKTRTTRKISKILIVVLSGSLLFQAVSLADSTKITQPQIDNVGNVSLASAITAKQWGLSVEEYSHYRWLMQNTSSRFWYKDLDPAEVLALNTDDPIEQEKYAKIQAINMHIRVTRELMFDRAYSQAYRELYANEKPIQSFHEQIDLNKITLQSKDRIWLFVGTDTFLANSVYQKLIQVVERTPGAMLDIYFVGKNVIQENIRQWARTNDISQERVNQQITLNFGNERFEAITQHRLVNLPYIGIVHDQHFHQINLASLFENK